MVEDVDYWIVVFTEGVAEEEVMVYLLGMVPNSITEVFNILAVNIKVLEAVIHKAVILLFFSRW